MGSDHGADEEGYEAAVAYAVADGLGFTDDEVKWAVVPSTTSSSRAPKDFDFDINQVSYIREARPGRRLQRLRTTTSSRPSWWTSRPSIAKATSLADLKDAKLGAQIGTTSYDAILDTIQPEPGAERLQPRTTTPSARSRTGNIDGIVVDYPTSLYVDSRPGRRTTVVVGRLPRERARSTSASSSRRATLLRECVNQAIAELRSDGTLDAVRAEVDRGLGAASRSSSTA